MKKEASDPEIELTAIRERTSLLATEAVQDLLPILMEKAINGKTRDTLSIFEALADRTQFNKPEPKQEAQQPLINFNLNTTDMQNMLSGLTTITQNPKQLENSATPLQETSE